MSIYEKYKLDKSEDILTDKIPTIIEKSFYQIEEEYTSSGYDELYINENGKLKHIATEPRMFSILLLFLKKYRANPELLPKDLKHEHPSNYMSSEEIYKAMKLMLKPIRTFEEFKERLLLATKELSTVIEKRLDITSRYGEKLVFVNKREDFGSIINIYGEVIPILKSGEYEMDWEDAILFDRDKKIFECYSRDERTNDTPDRSNWSLDIKFYEEQYFYEYLLNEEIRAVRS